MRNKIQFKVLFLGILLLGSCRTADNKDSLIIDKGENTNGNFKKEKQVMEIKFSCGEDRISEYIKDGWKIIKEDTQEKICTWKSVPATKDCDMEKDKGCKITKPNKIGKETIYLLEK